MSSPGVMEPRLDFITLAVSDLSVSLAFYRDGLGLPTAGVVGSEYHDEVSGASGTIVFFELQGGLLLGLYERDNLARDASVAIAATGSPAFSLGHLVASRQEVDALVARAVAAGARLMGPARERPWGVYSAYVADPDGHLWEVGWNARAASSD
jgi:uncharacterized protein